MTTALSIYQGADEEIRIDLKESFAALADVIVGVRIDETLKKTCKKTLTGNAAVVADADPNKCIVRLFRSETRDWNPGQLILEVTKVRTDADFPGGQHIPQVVVACLFEPLLTKNA